MKKIPTILPKDPSDLGKVVSGKVMDGIVSFRLKIDGTSCMIKDGKPYCRFDVKTIKNKKGVKTVISMEELINKIPEGAIACQEPDSKSGHWPHWIPVTDAPEHKYIKEGFENLFNPVDGTYECIGPKLQGNPHNVDKHLWVAHFSDLLIFDLNEDGWRKDAFEFFNKFFKEFHWEGLVAYDKNNVPIGKIRRSDFGYEKISYSTPPVC